MACCKPKTPKFQENKPSTTGKASGKGRTNNK